MSNEEQQQLLSPEQVSTYLNDGVLVVDNLLSPSEVGDAQTSLAQTLLDDLNVDVSNLHETGHNLTKASSTNGAGGVLDIFYPQWKMIRILGAFINDRNEDKLREKIDKLSSEEGLLEAFLESAVQVR